MQPTSIDVEVFIESLLQAPDELAVLYPGCSLESRVAVDVAGSSRFNLPMVSSLEYPTGNSQMDVYVHTYVGYTNAEVDRYSKEDMYCTLGTFDIPVNSMLCLVILVRL